MRSPLGGMGSQLRGRGSEYQPSASGVHGVEAKRVLKERARCDSVVREQNRVQADDHVGESVLSARASRRRWDFRRDTGQKVGASATPERA